jgi:hypothetical protein
MAFKLLVKKSTNALAQGTLDLGELGLRYTTELIEGNTVVTGGQLYVGLGATNANGYAAISMVGHTHNLAAITANASGSNFAAGDIIYASGATTLTTLAKGDNGQVLTLASGIPSWATPAAINDGTLTFSIGAAAATNNTVTVATGTGFSANTATNATYQISVGPALTNLATTMTSENLGFLKKTGVDTYTLDANTYVVANPAITAATKTKITYDIKGLVTAGADLEATDIPVLSADKITSGTFDAARIPTLDIATKTSGTLAVARGGTGAETLTAGSLLVGNGTGAITAGYTVETTLTGATTAIPRADAVKTYIDNFLGANDAMVFKGTIGTSPATIQTLPTTYSAGWAYRVVTAAVYAGINTEVGDLIIAVIDREGSGNVNSDWTVVQTNLDGAVIGPASAVAANFASFNGTTGKLIADSGFNGTSFSLADHTHTYLQLTDTPSDYTTMTVASGDGAHSNKLVVINGAGTGLVHTNQLDCGTW